MQMPSLSRSYDEEPEEEHGDEPSMGAESSSSSPRIPKPPKVVASRYHLGKKVGSGSYSDVHLAVDKVSGDSVAVKLEWKRAEKTGKLLDEAKLYQNLQTDIGIPKVRWWGSKGEYNIMVLDLLGPSLDDIFKKRKRFSVKTVAMLAKQMIDRLEYVHERGLLYRDIKPHNFLMGTGEKGSGRVYLIDFGLAKRYRDEESNKHCKLKVKKGRGITGTVRYSSLNVHEGYDASRRDDLLALGYVLLHFLRGGLPWMGLKAKSKSKKAKHELIRKRKAQTSDEDLCEGFPHEFVDFFKYCRSLEFLDRPDYAKLQRLLDSVLHQGGFVNDFTYDWTAKEQGQSRASSSNDSKDSRDTMAETLDTSSRKRKHITEMYAEV